MIDTIQVRTMAIHSHVLTASSKAPKMSLKKRNVMSVVVALLILSVWIQRPPTKPARKLERRPRHARRHASRPNRRPLLESAPKMPLPPRGVLRKLNGRD